ncbi:MAG: ABC transporter substrate-binding protein [Coprobacillus sp.]|nr:ABC transporter substrate-binding protein [Coprobacillus sp.]
MKLGKTKSIMILALVATLSACNGTSHGELYTISSSAKYGIAGLDAYDTYNVYLNPGSNYTTLDYTQSAEQTTFEDYVINCIDGLLTTDEFGVIQLQLAKSATHNDDYSEFSFEIREGVPWVTNKGKEYKHQGTVQYVCAEDWVTTAKAILDYSRASDTYYLLTMFIEGASEYYWYSAVQYNLAMGVTSLGGGAFDISTPQGVADAVNYYVEGYDGLESNVTVDDLDDIASGARLGVTATEGGANGGGTLTYKLVKSADYFPSSLNYAMGIPTNQYFFDDCGDKFGTSNDKLLYCGPYLFTKDNQTLQRFEANPTYWDKDSVHLQTINYIFTPQSPDYDYSRRGFENGETDSFTLNSNDIEGWEKYVTGPNVGTADEPVYEGTLQDPINPLTYSRFSETIGGIYDCEVVPGRDLEVVTGKAGDYEDAHGIAASEDGSQMIVSYCTPTDFEDIMNTANALSIQEVRVALLEAFDVDIFLEQVSTDPEVRESRAKHTYTPKGLAVDDYNNDYCGYYYVREFAKQELVGESDGNGGTLDENGAIAKAEEVLAGGTYGYMPDGSVLCYPTETIMNEKVEAAKAAITAYNSAVESGTIAQGATLSDGTTASSSAAQITFPIEVSYGGAWYDETNKANAQEQVASMNQWLNGLTDKEMESVKTDQTTLKVISWEPDTTVHPSCTGVPSELWMWMYIDDQVNDSTDYRAERYGQADFFSLWGWGADYADPLTYLNTFVIGGDWSSVYPFVGQDQVDSYHMEGESIVGTNLLKEYTDLVQEGTKSSDKQDRFATYAEAEYLLCRQLGLSKPLYNDSQGWILTVGNTATYERPICSFGISEGRYTGFYVLANTPTNTQRQAWKASYDAAAAEVDASMNIY